MKSYFLALLLSVSVFVSCMSIVHASDFSLKCDETKCTPASVTTFFDEEVLWYPTYSTSNVVTITNKADTNQYIGHRAYNVHSSSNADVAKVLDLVIVRSSVQKVVWQSTLREFYDTSEAVLGVLGPGKTDSFEYTITMNKHAGNKYQGQSTQFDMLFGYFTPTTTPNSTPSVSNKGEVQGASDSKIPEPITFPPVLQQLVSAIQDRLLPKINRETPIFASYVLGTQASPNIAKIVLLMLLTGSIGLLVYLIHLVRKRR